MTVGDDREVVREQEDAVWLLATFFDADVGKSCVAVIDGESVHSGPVCQLWLNHHLPHSLHGCFTEKIFDNRLLK